MGESCSQAPTGRLHGTNRDPIPLLLGDAQRERQRHHDLMTGPDVAMLALTLAGFVAIALLPYFAFKLLESAEVAMQRVQARHRA